VTPVPVLTAVSGAVWEADLVSAFERGDHGVAVVRRCVDLADLLATAAGGTARAVLLSADLRRLDRDALTRLATARVAVVGLVPPGDEQAERRLRQLGLVAVLPADASPELISSAVRDATAALATDPARRALGLAEPREALDVGAAPEPSEVLADPGDVPPGAGRVVAVWGPTGAPGRTTVAVTVASELAALGVPVLLVDADVYGGAVAQALGLLDETPGLAAAARRANAGTLDVAALASLARQVVPSLRVLTGIARAERWVELRPASVDTVLALARSLAAVTVVDCAFCLEQDEELAYDTAAPRRNGATLAVLEAADEVLAVGSADPVGLQRLVRGLAELREAAPGAAPRVVVNRVRRGAVPGSPDREIRAALARYAGVGDAALVPADPEACDSALAAGRSLTEAAPSSPARAALRDLAAVVGQVSPPRTRTRRGRGRPRVTAAHRGA
jgi:MinD-like ATPase involved in chromosome partitioning or flagellar assembly